jgi:hypothetical protein
MTLRSPLALRTACAATSGLSVPAFTMVSPACPVLLSIESARYVGNGVLTGGSQVLPTQVPLDRMPQSS